MTDTWKIIRSEPQILGIPIIEYPANRARLGAFEIVLNLLDAINNVESNRMDGVEQFVQSLLLFHNVRISEEQYSALRQDGAIQFEDIDPQKKAEIKNLVTELNQTQTQTLADNLYNTVLTICGCQTETEVLPLLILALRSSCVTAGLRRKQEQRIPSWCSSVPKKSS